MPHYNCELCNFSTTLKGDFTRHKNTKKHRNNLIRYETSLEGLGVIIQNDPDGSKMIQKIILHDPKIIQ